MKILASALLDELKETTRQHLQYAQILTQKTEEELNFRTSQDSWSPLECLEHLNRYGAFYIPEISNRIAASKTTPGVDFKPGILGNYFANMMLPKKKQNAMKTLKAMNPIHSQLNKRVVEEFISQQKQLLELLEKAQNIDLERTKTSISISKLIKLKLGDTFRFVIYHNVRHIEQIKRILPH
ncbi:DinB family protein [Chryseobacterium panacisoli]|uniref:DinB family protein n=1 Tax=Chryseobacterium panacisoli TaxID=1807141 RepID=A0A5D8ZIW5_9FLAO|nr:DinB family protein [Chryseobacterium panacisoli]TZF94889.1 DinB family protein [Chryseobacterium panacisoli]